MLCLKTRQIVLTTITLLIMLVAGEGQAQSCSCGGPPLLTSLETPATPAGSWQIGLTYEFHSISDLVDDTRQLEDDIRDRSIKSGLLQIDYGINRRFSASLLLARLQQSRTTRPVASAGERVVTRGFGDVVLLVKYALVPVSVLSPYQLSLGVGVKAPLGKTDLRLNGFRIAADMQPGSGSWDGLIWGSASRVLRRASSFSLFGNVTYRKAGSYDRFGGQLPNYRVGNELLTSLGLGVDYSSAGSFTLAANYRSTTADRLGDWELPNSGGRWLNLETGTNLRVVPKITLRLSGELPVYRQLEGTQFSTSYSVGLALFYRIFQAPPEFGL